MSTSTITHALTAAEATYEVSPTILIDEAPETVWEYLVDVEEWWVASSPEHESLEVLSNDDELGEGTVLRVRESVAGLPGVVQGEITEFVPGERLTWEVPSARYRFFGWTLDVEEGVTWLVASTREGTQLTAYVWATFPETLLGKVARWTFRHVLNGVERDIDHARRELEYIKRTLEA